MDDDGSVKLRSGASAKAAPPKQRARLAAQAARQQQEAEQRQAAKQVVQAEQQQQLASDDQTQQQVQQQQQQLQQQLPPPLSHRYSQWPTAAAAPAKGHDSAASDGAALFRHIQQEQRSRHAAMSGRHPPASSQQQQEQPRSERAPRHGSVSGSAETLPSEPSSRAPWVDPDRGGDLASGPEPAPLARQERHRRQGGRRWPSQRAAEQSPAQRPRPASGEHHLSLRCRSSRGGAPPHAMALAAPGAGRTALHCCRFPQMCAWASRYVRQVSEGQRCMRAPTPGSGFRCPGLKPANPGGAKAAPDQCAADAVTNAVSAAQASVDLAADSVDETPGHPPQGSGNGSTGVDADGRTHSDGADGSGSDDVGAGPNRMPWTYDYMLFILPRQYTG